MKNSIGLNLFNQSMQIKPIYKRLIYWLISAVVVVVFFLFVLSRDIKHEYPVGMALLGGFLSLIVCLGATVTFLNAYPFKTQKHEGDASIALALISIFMLFVVGGTIIFQGSNFPKDELGRSGIETTAWVVHKSCGFGNTSFDKCKITLHFVDHTKSMIEGHLTVESGLCRCLAFGDTMGIVFSPKSKSTIKFSHLEQDSQRILSLCEGMDWKGGQIYQPK